MSKDRDELEKDEFEEFKERRKATFSEYESLLSKATNEADRKTIYTKFSSDLEHFEYILYGLTMKLFEEYNKIERDVYPHFNLSPSWKALSKIMTTPKLDQFIKNFDNDTIWVSERLHEAMMSELNNYLSLREKESKHAAGAGSDPAYGAGAGGDPGAAPAHGARGPAYGAGAAGAVAGPADASSAADDEDMPSAPGGVKNRRDRKGGF